MEFDQDKNGNWGYKINGNDPVIPFKNFIQKQYVSDMISSINAKTIDFSDYDDHEKWTVNNFSAEIFGTVGVNGGNLGDSTFTLNYNPKTGILSCSAGRVTHNPGGYMITLGAYYRIALFT